MHCRVPQAAQNSFRTLLLLLLRLINAAGLELKEGATAVSACLIGSVLCAACADDWYPDKCALNSGLWRIHLVSNGSCDQVYWRILQWRWCVSHPQAHPMSAFS